MVLEAEDVDGLGPEQVSELVQGLPAMMDEVEVRGDSCCLSGVLAAPGDAIALGTSAYVYVVRAFDLPIGDTRCLPDSTQSDRFIESVYVSN